MFEKLAGWETFQKTGKSLPVETIDALKNRCDGAVFGSVQSPSHKYVLESSSWMD